MDKNSYRHQQDLKNIEKIRELLEELPGFCKQYFLSLESRKSTNTRKNYAYDLLNFFHFLKEHNPYFEKREIHSLKVEELDLLSPMDIEEYMSYLQYYVRGQKQFTNSPEGRARKLSSLRTFYDYFLKKKMIQTNPARQVDVPKIKEHNIIRLEPNEVAELLDQTESGEKLTKKQLESHQKTKLRDVAILTLLLGTGIRVSECVGLNLNDVNFDDYSLKIIRKGGNEDLVFFGDEVADALFDYLENDRDFKTPVEGHEDALFISMKNMRLTTRSIERLVKKYTSGVTTLKRITPHKLRSTFGTNLYQETGDIYLVADTLGHKDVNTTRKHYAGMKEANKRKAAKALRLRENRPAPDSESVPNTKITPDTDHSSNEDIINQTN
ncbi:MAG: tyrosine-type recombinase/integrase [Lachnospiraceae bacterium]|nr:tyrosine-type recombinase/integrase [Lachnospiraceae bacterium]